jgi:hypothetical protein
MKLDKSNLLCTKRASLFNQSILILVTGFMTQSNIKSLFNLVNSKSTKNMFLLFYLKSDVCSWRLLVLLQLLPMPLTFRQVFLNLN